MIGILLVFLTLLATSPIVEPPEWGHVGASRPSRGTRKIPGRRNRTAQGKKFPRASLPLRAGAGWNPPSGPRFYFLG